VWYLEEANFCFIAVLSYFSTENPCRLHSKMIIITGRAMTASHLIFHCHDDVIHALCGQHKLNKTIVYIIISIESNTNSRTETSNTFLTIVLCLSTTFFSQ
jgi:uncharacterized membrane protein YuzA (DUF378 family)